MGHISQPLGLSLLFTHLCYNRHCSLDPSERAHQVIFFVCAPPSSRLSTVEMALALQLLQLPQQAGLLPSTGAL